jgi:hypothetical protein
MSFESVAILISGAAAVVGFFLAWRSRGEVIDAEQKVADANAALQAARAETFVSAARMVTATTQLSEQQARTDALTKELAAERVSRQALVDALAKAGASVGDVVVDQSLDRLYKDSGGQDSGAGTSGGTPGVSGQPTPAPTGPASSR